jgi:hypothetical protein
MGGQRVRLVKRDESAVGGGATHSNSIGASSKITHTPTIATVVKSATANPIVQSSSINSNASVVSWEKSSATFVQPRNEAESSVSIPKLQLDNIRVPVRKISHSQKGGMKRSLFSFRFVFFCLVD